MARPLLERNPGVGLHHMHDGNQDRLMVSAMSYFRCKYLTLPPAYERFLTTRLRPGAPVVIVDDRTRWPTTRVAERHVFQTGARGGLDPYEYVRGSPRVARFLNDEGSRRRRFDAPEPDGESPEAEWGFEPAMEADIRLWAEGSGHPVRRLVLDSPEALSAPVADLYRRWLEARDLPADRVLAESFIALDPHRVLTRGLVPLWTLFPVESSVEVLQDYVKGRSGINEVLITLFPHGVHSAGLAPPDRWLHAVEESGRRGRLLGVDARRFPADFGTIARFGPALSRLHPPYPSPEPLEFADADRFLAASHIDGLRWT
ncbi:MAG: hypothetical protein GEV03_21325 [Streptosporangiales bacterium]|nr:hypothetical protein [Streptosporangiales bacterium]